MTDDKLIDPNETILPCPFCGSEPEHSAHILALPERLVYLWCSGTKANYHHLVNMPFREWQARAMPYWVME